MIQIALCAGPGAPSYLNNLKDNKTYEACEKTDFGAFYGYDDDFTPTAKSDSAKDVQKKNHVPDYKAHNQIANTFNGRNKRDYSKGTEKVLFNTIRYDMADKVFMVTPSKWTNKQFEFLYFGLAKMLGALGNSVHKDLGAFLVKEFIEFLKDHCQLYGVDLPSKEDDILEAIKNCTFTDLNNCLMEYKEDGSVFGAGKDEEDRSEMDIEEEDYDDGLDDDEIEELKEAVGDSGEGNQQNGNFNYGDYYRQYGQNAAQHYGGNRYYGK